VKTCPRCHLQKPDAVFLKWMKFRYMGPPRVLKECENCRAHRKQGRLKSRSLRTKMLTTQAPPIKISKEDRKLVTLARRERKEFRRRGSPEVERPYSYIGGNPAKGLAGQSWSASFKQSF